MEAKPNLFGLTRTDMIRAISGMDLPAYRGRQIYRWMYARGVDRFDQMTDLPKAVRTGLSERFEIRRPSIRRRHRSLDGTVKYLFSLEDGGSVEAVYIPESDSGQKPHRHTICLSTQIGCPLGCTFCYSGTVRFSRNLSAGEVLGQLVSVRNELDPRPSRVNVVFMGMGEPLLNSQAVLAAIAIMSDPEALAISPRRITVSTAGLVGELEEFTRKAPPVGLAVSLHATTDETRGRIMPINRKHGLDELMEAVRRLPLPRRRKITFEYVLLKGVNDSEKDARRLGRLLRGVKSKVNVISYNSWPGSPHQSSTPEATERFIQILIGAGYTVSLRRSRGDDILAACGQLVGGPGTLT
jgi:23S rRNA (adenine2503-C2)-methyltransferase